MLQIVIKHNHLRLSQRQSYSYNHELHKLARIIGERIRYKKDIDED